MVRARQRLSAQRCACKTRPARSVQVRAGGLVAHECELGPRKEALGSTRYVVQRLRCARHVQLKGARGLCKLLWLLLVKQFVSAAN